jgi:Zn-dependent protease
MPAASMLSLVHLLPPGLVAGWFGLVLSLPLLVLLVLALRRAGRARAVAVRESVSAAAMPEEFARCSQPWLGRLAYLGFPLVQVLRRDDGEIEWLMAHPREAALAVLHGTQPPGGGRPTFALTLTTFLRDGRVVVTAGHPLSHRPPPHWSLLQRRFDTLEEQVSAHRNHVIARVDGVAVVLIPPANQLPRLAAEEQAVVDALLNSGDYRTSADGRARPALRGLPRLAALDFAALAGGFRHGDRTRRDIASVGRAGLPGEEETVPNSGGTAPTIEEWVERDLRRYRSHADRPAGAGHALLRFMLAAATVVVFTAVFDRGDPLGTAAMVAGLVALHEFGHWAAMRMAGYRGMGRFFLPFLSPLDRGRKLHAPAWQQLAVILAGPLPGLLGGMALVVAGAFTEALPAWLTDLGGLAVVLNAFHLLPFLPLDGGKVVDLLVFRDLPFLRPLFTAASASATLAASFLTRSRAMRVIAIGMFAGLIWDIRMIKVVRGGRRLGWKMDDEDEALRRIFRGVRDEGNDGFLRSADWQRQIDVLLAEVLRRKPRFMLRLLGGGLYLTACLLPLALVAAIFALPMAGNLVQLGKLGTDIGEFAAAYPVEKRSITPEQHSSLVRLLATEETPPGTEALDRIDWTAAGILHHCDELPTAALDSWMTSLCGTLEATLAAGRRDEALRRAEVLLFAIASMEPALTLADRRVLWHAELRTLACVDQLAATGALPPAALQRLSTRITALNKAAVPEVENLLLVGGWGKARSQDYFALQDGRLPESFDLRFWRQAAPALRGLAENLKALNRGPSTSVALARHWKESRRAGMLPDTLDAAGTPAPGESDFIVDFCRRHREARWRRTTTLSALRLEAYRSRHGRLPERWTHPLPDGATLSLAMADGPQLVLTDDRATRPRRLPAWLGGGPDEALPAYRCPLHPGSR